MFINGKYSNAEVFSKAISPFAISQVKSLCDNEVSAGSRIRIMPDVHPGKVFPIGLTMTIGERILPNLVGIDIGCGVTAARITKHRGMEYQRLDSVLRENVPSGFEIRKKIHRYIERFDFSSLECKRHINMEKTSFSLCSLGGGNHFIEIGMDEQKDFYIAVHTGSRHLGKEVTDYYMHLGKIQLKKKKEEIPYEMTYLEGDIMTSYIHDMKAVENFASLNRLAIIDEITAGMKWKTEEPFSCIHDNTVCKGGELILRKGAISSLKDENVIIPINMKDGIILGKGKGNKDWNYSAPHGAGRIMNRESVKKNFTVSNYKAVMKDIHSCCIDETTLDEAPFAYRQIDEIINAVSESVKIEKILKPTYNYKGASVDR